MDRKQREKKKKDVRIQINTSVKKIMSVQLLVDLIINNFQAISNNMS